jgi:hypothetical protein
MLLWIFLFGNLDDDQVTMGKMLQVFLIDRAQPLAVLDRMSEIELACEF